MSTTFETVLEQANTLSVADRQKLVEVLKKKSNGRKTREKKWDDDPLVKTLRAWVDEMEKTENPKRNSSAKIAERIRKWNDRGYTL